MPSIDRAEMYQATPLPGWTGGSVAAIPPNTPHSARPLGACSAIIVDSPRRPQLPGVPPDAAVPDLAAP